MIQKNNTIMKNNTKMETQIIKHGDFTLKHFKHYDIYSLLYKDSPIWGGELYELLDTRLIDRVLEREPESKKAVEFLNELYQWVFSQQGAFEKLLDSVYGEEKQLNDEK